MAVTLFILLLASLVFDVLGCMEVAFSSLDYIFHQIPIEELDPKIISTGRPYYQTENHNLFIYHILLPDGVGQWVVSETLTNLVNEIRAIAFVNSYAVTPYLMLEVADRNTWKIRTSTHWVADVHAKVICVSAGGDETVYFDSNPQLALSLSGFYTLRKSHDLNPVYSQVKYDPRTPQKYLFFAGNKWMIGATVGVDDCETYMENDVWHYIVERLGQYVWTPQTAHLISRFNTCSADPFNNIYLSLRYYRSLKNVPANQVSYTLRNHIPMPVVGLGTGGLRTDETPAVLKEALSLGYRLFDLAREYGNEHMIKDLFNYDRSADLPPREEVFLVTKVWPTELGFDVSSSAVMNSLESLGTNYIDLFLIHWPFCNPNVEWMHCETTVDPHGTWQSTWLALEKAYAEGYLMSIGVSNFDMPLLSSMNDQTSGITVLPHVVQNWAEPGSVDVRVVEWCGATNTVFQTYASIRNLHQLSSSKQKTIKALLSDLSAKYNVSEQAVALRLMVQSGFAIIPRASQRTHLAENINVLGWHLEAEDMTSIFH